MNNSSNTSCYLGDDIYLIRDHLCFAAYVVATPIYFVFGVITRAICVFAFYRQYKTEGAYAYQILVAMCDTMEILTATLCMCTINNLSGWRLPGALWYQENYALMWFAAHLAAMLYQACVTVSLLISLSMVADRVFSLAKPILYNSIEHGHYQKKAIALSFLIGFSLSVFDIFRYNLIEEDNRYKIMLDSYQANATWTFALALSRNVVRMVANIALIAGNVVIVILYHRQANKVAASGNNERIYQRRKATEKTLVLLTICQSTFTTVDIMFFNVYYTLGYSVSNFLVCFGKVMAPVNDLVLELASILEFFALFTISKSYRKTIISCLRCRKIHVSEGGEFAPNHS